MFGPDFCGYETSKVHFIINYKGENQQITKSIAATKDQLTRTHIYDINIIDLYTLIINPDKTYKILIDLEEKATGSLLEDWDLFGPKEIKDPKQSKPTDWVDQAEIPDPNDKKPADWVDEAKIVDANAKVPEDW